MADGVLEGVITDLERAEKHHDPFVDKCEKRYRSYRGVLERTSEASKWTSKLHPPYILQIVETIVGNLIDDVTRFKVTPRPFLADMNTIEQRKTAARSLEYLLRYQLSHDRFDEKKRPFALQASVCGLTVGKTYWKYAARNVTRQRVTTKEIVHPSTGEPLGSVPVIAPIALAEVTHDDPTFDVVDVRDFLWHEAATDIQSAKYVIHRSWWTFDDLKAMEARGVYKNVDQLKETRDFTAKQADREQSLFQRNRTKDLIEVVERWNRDGVVTIGNRDVVLSDRPNPFWHGEYPFVVTSTAPDLFQIPGISDVEIVEELQEMLWTVMNQRLDNLMLINNAIVLLRSDIDDPDSFEFAPGERWLVDDPAQVEMWTPNAMPAQVSIEAEGLIKGDLQNITGGMPFASGADTQSIDQKTATGVSIVSTLAQRRLATKKQNVSFAFQRVGEQFVSLLQQFIREPRIAQVVGPDARTDFIEVKPGDIQGRFNVEVDPSSDSFMRQERRAESQALVQMAAQIAPVMAAVQQPLNLKSFVEDWLESYDVLDTERYFSAQPQALGPQGQQQQGQPQDGSPPNGVTAPQSIDPAVSPSNQVTMAPSSFNQRLSARTQGAGS